ncbi:MAG: carboxylate--amine ligase [Dehalococcoidia bacterium]|nr:carboxylate--amine ligase [Dehalococcoidia bacterium]
MKRILLTGAGGAASINFTRSLKMAPEPFFIIGVDCNPYYLQRAETDEKYLVPRATEGDYIAVINTIAHRSGAELVCAQPDVEVAVLSRYREKLSSRTFLPRHETVEICQNKYESFRHWQEAGIKVPNTRMIHTMEDLETAFRQFHGQVWLRAITGAGGRGAFPTSDLNQARAWLDFNNGWGQFTAAEYLSPDSVTWQSIWKDGELVVAQGRKRIYWEYGDQSISGVTGITGAAVTVSDPIVDDVAQKAIKAIDTTPHGIFAVDLTYDQQGIPNPTEINIGRFFTTHHFFTKAGLNMPYIFVKLAYGEEPPEITRRVNPLPPGLLWIRGMDMEPVLASHEILGIYEGQLNTLRNSLAGVPDV